MPILSPMTNDVEIPWENGQLAMHGHESASDTLESIILQATACYSRRQNLDVDPQQSQNFDVDQQQSQNFDIDPQQDKRRLHHKSSIITSSSGKYHESSGPSYAKKRQCLRNLAATSFKDDIARIKSKDNGMTWPPFESSNQDNQDSECKIQREKVRSHSTQQRRAAAIHNQSERRRREKINQKLRDLQKLLPDSDKTDKASMLDKAIVYLKKLKEQVDLMKNIPMLPQMAFQLQQQQQQMWMLAGMQMGIPGVMSPAAHHPFMAPQTMISPAHVAVMPQPSHGLSASTASVPLGDPYIRFLAQVSSCGPGN